MLTEAAIPGSDDWYLLELATEMGANFPRMHRLRRYREGDAPVPDEASGGQRAAYMRFIAMSRLNMCSLIVNAKTNRQKPVGFRTAAEGDEMGDDLAWKAYRRSRMSVGSRQLFTDAGHYGSSFITVFGANADALTGEPLEPYMVTSTPWTTWTRQDPQRSWVTSHAITVGHDAILGVDQIILYGRGWARIAQRKVARTTIPNNGSVWSPGADWTWAGERTVLDWTVDCPVVKYSTLDGMGLYEAHTDTIDRINDTIKERVTITAMQAFTQRAIKGNLPTHYPADDTQGRAGQPIDYNDIFAAGPAALWLLPEDAEIWESKVTDITPIIAAAKDDMKNLAAVTATPLYVLSPDAASGSAEGAASAKETLIFSVEELNDIADGTFANVFSLIFQALNDTVRADPGGLETIWASIDRMTIAERSSAASQAKAGGMPQRFIDEKIFGFTPAEVRQAAQDRDDEAFLGTTATVDPITAPVAPNVAEIPPVVDELIAA